MNWRPYVIVQGDYLAELAERFGFDASAVWQDDRNAELRERRSNPQMLLPGDVLQVSESEPEMFDFSLQTTNRYAASIPRVAVDVVFPDAANEPYRVTGLAQPLEGQADGDGRIRFSAPMHIRDLTLELVNRFEHHPIRIGHLDPVDAPSGVRQRLQHLGHHGAFPTSTGALPDQAALDRQAIESFQRAHELTVTGVVDDATRERLLTEHGS